MHDRDNINYDKKESGTIRGDADVWKGIVPTDFSEYAKKTILCVTRIPGIQEIVLQHGVDAPSTPSTY